MTPPEIYDARMKLLRLPLFVLLEWLLAVPVIFHALNGGRLMLYEIFGNRKDALVLRWALGLSVAPVVRDLIVDTEKAYQRIDQVKPYIIEPQPSPADGQEHPIKPGELERYVNALKSGHLTGVDG